MHANYTFIVAHYFWFINKGFPFAPYRSHPACFPNPIPPLQGLSIKSIGSLMVAEVV